VRRKVARVAGWVLFGTGIFAIVEALVTRPFRVVYELPVTVAFIVGGWILAHIKQKST